jgi:hypothetical protein
MNESPPFLMRHAQWRNAGYIFERKRGIELSRDVWAKCAVLYAWVSKK